MNPLYNLVQYLRDSFPGESFYCNQQENTALQVTLPDRCASVRQTGGPVQPWTKYTQVTCQILVRDLDTPAAEKFAKDIYDLLNGRFGLILPDALNVGGVDYIAPTTAQISAIQFPYCLGQDSAGRTSFTTNYKIIFEE